MKLERGIARPILAQLREFIGAQRPAKAGAPSPVRRGIAAPRYDVDHLAVRIDGRQDMQRSLAGLIQAAFDPLDVPDTQRALPRTELGHAPAGDAPGETGNASCRGTGGPD